MSQTLQQELDYRDCDDSFSETQLPDDVVPTSITDHMSVEHVAAYLKDHGIPSGFCDIFKGRIRLVIAVGSH